HLGSIRQVTNWLGQQVSRHRYYPFGQEATPSSTTDPVHKFTGHERDLGFDSETPLDYMHARYCSPVLGRFLSVDPILGEAATPQGWNRYAYVRNRPLNYTDPTGEVADIAVDIGFIAYDLGDIAASVIAGEGVSGEQVLALAADIVGAAIPFATGLGAAVRVASKGDGAVDAAKGASNASAGASRASGSTLPVDESQLRHIFREAPGHLADTPANRKLLQNVADDVGTTLGKDRFGNIWSARTLDDGTQVWVQVRNGVIQNGGVNPTPRIFSPENGLTRGGG
ncbi:MAG: RHS repeat-associated core domain-containing protein, partial [Holophagales bacterium]|nr:RHS repeat-associated core domain-containing protein [Holophagales bacterium]